MEEFQKEHRDVQDRRPFFFFVIFLFLSAMFGLVISNNLLIMYTCWEITSLCSFLLIGYTQTEEAVENSFKALWMNLLGGVAFAAAILWLGAEYESVELSMLINLGRSSQPVEIAVALLVFCGFTKAAMMPFSGWLLGAMVAPTPTSALLHSSTMVKAGVFLIIKLCPVLGPNHAGLMTMFIGGATFLFASFVAISQSDGKKVLAYSTISNLGLIVCCAGIGSYEAAWTAIMIVVFHAVAKSLMFLSVGTAEQQLGSRNIENFDGMFCSLPGLSLCMIIGICGMFLAPFGMLISKWAAMKAFVDAGHPLLLLVLVFGSSTTLFYWTKWLGKITAYIPAEKNLEEGIHGVEWLALRTLSALTIVTCVLFPVISQMAVIPYLEVTYETTMEVISRSNLLIMSMMVLLLVVLPLRFGKGQEKKLVVTNLAGENLGDNQSYRGAAGQVIPVTVRNWYMEKWFGEAKMKLCGFILCGCCLLIEFAIIFGGAFHV
jgi:ech hydrogenase subunit A